VSARTVTKAIACLVSLVNHFTSDCPATGLVLYFSWVQALWFRNANFLERSKVNKQRVSRSLLFVNIVVIMPTICLMLVVAVSILV